ncbi:hypothetical protein F4808DRAFT_66992 [Astrocystis sublimbata]|nr:hypothetical protein F4808DRAFT_66992 [Astrocystis sublimbata]
MSSNNDNAMTRFLFAILKQKNLKDIDWNAVAHDPILSQPITNGHAARMRYSRFRSVMLGLEPTRRNRVAEPAKNRVTKSKKDPKAQQHKSRKDDNVKSETASAPESPVTRAASPEPVPPPPSQPKPQQKIKQEPMAYNHNSRMTPSLTPGPVSVPPPLTITNPSTIMHHRFLTPSSDTDAFSPSPALAPSPTGMEFPQHSQMTYDIHGHDQLDPTWAHLPSYFAAAAFPYEELMHSPCDHQHLSHQHQLHSQGQGHGQCQYHMPSQSIESDNNMERQMEFKREEWLD